MSLHDTNCLAWPLIFRHRGTTVGRGFVAEIEMDGRLLGTFDVDGVWLYGVNPGALAVNADNLASTNAALRETLARLCVDFAVQAETFADFKAAVETFFFESDDESLREWERARDAVRDGRVALPFGLSRQEAPTPTVRVTEKQLEDLTPKDNGIVQQESEPALSAAA
jgi:hypothetical protein